MNETVAIGIFVAIMIFIELRDIKKIIIRTRTNYIRMIMSVLVSVSSTIIFWTNEPSRQIELLLISLLILFFGFVPEGLGKNQVIKVGTLNGLYSKYEKIELQNEDKKNRFTRINFFVRKNNSSPLVVRGNVDTINKFLQQNIKQSKKVIIK